MTLAKHAYQTLLKIGDGGGPEVFTTVAEVVNIGGPSLSADVIDVTSHDSPGAHREKIAGLLDAGEVSLELNFIPTAATQGNVSGLLRDYRNRNVRNFQLVFPGGTTWAFAALVTNYEPGANVEDKLSLSVTLTVTGQPTLA